MHRNRTPFLSPNIVDSENNQPFTDTEESDAITTTKLSSRAQQPSQQIVVTRIAPEQAQAIANVPFLAVANPRRRNRFFQPDSRENDLPSANISRGRGFTSGS